MTVAQLRALSPRDIPARSEAATRVLVIIDDPDTNVAHIAAAVGADPAFASKAIALANSAYYGLSGRVGTLNYAISVLGFQTVRALAVSKAAGLDGPNAVPAGFWDSAATAATAANVVAPIFGANPPDAFCAGLLHTLGSALLHQHAPGAAVCLPAPDEPADAAQFELSTYGIGHAELGAEVLASWRFPARLCTLIAEHHDGPSADADPLTRTLHVARAVTDLVLRTARDGRSEAGSGAVANVVHLTDGALTPPQVQALALRIGEQAAALIEGLGSI